MYDNDTYKPTGIVGQIDFSIKTRALLSHSHSQAENFEWAP